MSRRVVASTRLIACSIYMLAAFAPAMVAIQGRDDKLNEGLVDIGISVTGIVSYAILSLQFVLAARIKWVEKRVGATEILGVHKTMALVATALVLIHVGMIGWSRSDWSLVFSPWVSWPIYAGRVAAIALLVTLGYSLGRRFIPLNRADWRFFHNVLAWTILIAGFTHGVVMGASFEDSTFAMIWIGYFALALTVWTRRQMPNAIR